MLELHCVNNRNNNEDIFNRLALPFVKVDDMTKGVEMQFNSGIDTESRLKFEL